MKTLKPSEEDRRRMCSLSGRLISSFSLACVHTRSTSLLSCSASLCKQHFPSQLPCPTGPGSVKSLSYQVVLLGSS